MVKYEIKFYDWNNNIVGNWADDDKKYIAKLFEDTKNHNKENIHDNLGINSDIELRLMVLFDNVKGQEIESFFFE